VFKSDYKREISAVRLKNSLDAEGAHEVKALKQASFYRFLCKPAKTASGLAKCIAPQQFRLSRQVFRQQFCL
jgi:hypothetical protein